jgi:hypothetical protein
MVRILARNAMIQRLQKRCETIVVFRVDQECFYKRFAEKLNT